MKGPDETITQTSIVEGHDVGRLSAISSSKGEGLPGEGHLPSATPCGRLQELAFSEMAKRRRRLGALTVEQERALESLLETVVTRLSLMLSAVGAVDE